MSRASDTEPDLVGWEGESRNQGTGKRIYVGNTDIEAIARVGSSVLAASNRVAKRVARIIDRLPSGWPIGLERNLLTYPLPEIGISLAGHKLLEQRGVRYAESAAFPKLFKRPPSEYGLVRLFQALERGCIEPDDIFAAVRLMGGEGAWRTRRVRTSSFGSGHFTEFMNASSARRAFRLLLAEIFAPQQAGDAIIRATRIYFATTLYHPLVDGNGRLARALYQCVLRIDLGLPSPVFPLGPIFYANRYRVLEAKHLWQLAGNASDLAKIVIDSMNHYCDLYEAPENMLGLRI